MNRFLTRRKTRDGASGDDAVSPISSTPPALPQSAPKKTWRKRKPLPEAKKEVNLDTYLPSSDSFRTSLMMPNLSTRFSMLRDLDDPHSLIGKASDDSVLEPKRQSRLMEFGFHPRGLKDISEMSSLRDPRPPFAYRRQASYNSGDGYGTDDESLHSGSIMSRSRPGEGNVLFGGRQKIYKIPIGDSGSVKSLGTGEPRGMRGRALYEDDVSMSAFQRYREKEKQRQHDGDSVDDSEGDPETDSLAKDNLNSPSFYSYNENRETVSSTNSGPSMLSSSTAPTSVASQGHASAPGSSPAFSSPPFDQPVSKTRRMYEQGLDQHVHEQQSAALTRLNSMQRKSSSAGPNTVYQSRSATNLNESYSRTPSTSSRTASPLPPVSAEQMTHFGSTKPRRPSASTKTSASAISPALTPLEDDKNDHDVLAQALDPSDRGKATALGAFNRPKKFDDQQYVQRQLSLLQQQTSRQKWNMSSRNATSPVKSSTRPSVEDSRNRAGSTRTDRSWSASSSVRDARNASLDDQSSTGVESEPRASESSESKMVALSHSTSISSSAHEENEKDSLDNTFPQSRSIRDPSYSLEESSSTLTGSGPEEVHPALRTLSTSQDQQLESEAKPRDTSGALDMMRSSQQKDSGVDFDNSSPTSGPNADTLLGGMVREHLRQRSNGSSIYPTRGPGTEDRKSGFDFRVPSIYGQSNQWGLDDFRTAFPDSPSAASVAFPARPDSHVLPGNSARESLNDDGADWERELRKHHVRAGSAETQAEREAFANELIQRQRAIQENLKIKVENDSRAASPLVPSANNNALRPFALLRPRPSNENMTTKTEIPAAKPLKSDWERTKSPPAVGRTLHSRMPGAADDHVRPSMDSARYRKDAERPRDHPVEIYRTPPESLTSSTRNRSSSETSQSNARNRDDLEKTSTRGAAFYERSGGRSSPMFSQASTREANVEAARARNNPKTTRPPKVLTESAAKSFRNRRNSPSSATSDVSSLASPSVETPYSENSTPPLSANPRSPTSKNTFRADGIPSGEKVPFVFPVNTGRGPASSNRKKTIQKQEISEPTLISHTSTIDTVNLPAGVSLRGGSMDVQPSSAPPPSVPPMNPLRRGFFSAFSRSHSDHVLANGDAKGKPIDEYGDEELMPGQRLRIRKISSEGGDIRRKGRLMAVRDDSPTGNDSY